MPAPVPPQQLLSLNVPVAASSDGEHAPSVADGQWRTWAGWRPLTPDVTHPQWLALDLGPGPLPDAVLLVWNAGNNTNWNETLYGGLGAYQVQTSADSRTGADGTWTTVVTVEANTVRTRAHRVPFAGQRWLRLWVTALAPQATVAAVDEVAVYDANEDVAESWVFVGDSITAGAFDRATEHGPAFADLLHTAIPAIWPVMINAGVGGETTVGAAARLERLLAFYPDVRYWVLAFGTNDVASDPSGAGAAAFAARMGVLAARIAGAGHTPILGRIPYSRAPMHVAIPAYNAALAALAAQRGLALGPDTYSAFAANPDLLSPDGFHPSNAGAQALNRLWATWHLAGQP